MSVTYKYFCVQQLLKIAPLKRPHPFPVADGVLAFSECDPSCIACKGAGGDCIYSTPTLYIYDTVEVFLDINEAQEFICLNRELLHKPRIHHKTISELNNGIRKAIDAVREAV